MADTDGDIKLSVSLKPTDIRKSADVLRKAVEGVFDSTKGQEVSKPIEKLQMAMDKATSKAQKLTQQMSSMEKPTSAYRSLSKDLEYVTSKYEQLSAAAQKEGVNFAHQEELETAKQAMIDLQAQMQQLRDSGKGFTIDTANEQKYEALSLQLGSVNNEIQSLLNAYNQLVQQEAVSAEEAERAAQAEQEYQNQLQEIANSAEVADQSIVDLIDRQASLEQQLEELNATREQMEEAGVGLGHTQYDQVIQDIARVEAEWGEVTTQVEAYREQVSSIPAPKEPLTLLNFFKAVGRDVGGVLSQIGSRASEAFSQFREQSIMASNAIKGRLMGVLTKLGNKIKQTFSGKSIKHNFMTVLKYTLGIRSLYILFNKLRSAVKESINNIAQWNNGNNKVNESMTAITSSLTAFKNSVGAAAAPLLNMLAPALTTIIDLATQAANAIARFFAALTGASTVIQATKTQKDYAKSLGGTASGSSKAKKETDKLLASFDDLNVLGKENDTDSSGGGGGATSGIQDMFTEIETPFSNLAEKLKEAIASGDLSGIGQMIGEKIRDSLDNIDWESIREKLSKGISLVTSGINGLLATEGLGASLGTSLAEALNTAVMGLRQFINEIDWRGILGNIGASLSSFLSTVDFGEIMLTVGDSLIKAFEGLSGFLENLDLHAVLDNVVAGIKKFFEEYDWASLFKGFGRLLGDVAVLVAELIDWLAEGFCDLLINFEQYFGPYIEPYLDAFGDNPSWWEIGGAIIAGIYDGIVDALANVYAWIIDNIFTPMVDGVCEAFGIASPSKVFEEIGGYLIDGLLLGLSNLISLVSEPFYKLKTKLSEIFEATKTLAVNVWNALKLKLQLIVLAIKGIITKPFESVKETVINLTSSLKESVVQLWNGIWTGIKGVINKIIGGIESFCNAIIDGVNSVLGLLNVADKLPDAVKEYVGLDSFTIPNLSHISIPRLAQGAVIPPNKQFLAMLGDQRSGTNIEAPLDTIVDAFRQAVGDMQGTGSPTVINLQIDAQTFARLNVPYEVKEMSRLGYNVKVMEG